jgi:hypothetical protein
MQSCDAGDLGQQRFLRSYPESHFSILVLTQGRSAKSLGNNPYLLSFHFGQFSPLLTVSAIAEIVGVR